MQNPSKGEALGLALENGGAEPPGSPKNLAKCKCRPSNLLAAPAIRMHTCAWGPHKEHALGDACAHSCEPLRVLQELPHLPGTPCSAYRSHV